MPLSYSFKQLADNLTLILKRHQFAIYWLTQFGNEQPAINEQTVSTLHLGIQVFKFNSLNKSYLVLKTW